LERLRFQPRLLLKPFVQFFGLSAIRKPPDHDFDDLGGMSAFRRLSASTGNNLSGIEPHASHDRHRLRIPKSPDQIIAGNVHRVQYGDGKGRD
jgi:hypothetical protein